MLMCLVLHFFLLRFASLIFNSISPNNLVSGHIHRFDAKHLLHWPWGRLGPQRKVGLTFGSSYAELQHRVEEYLTGKNLVDEGVFKEAIHLVRQKSSKKTSAIPEHSSILPCCQFTMHYVHPAPIQYSSPSLVHLLQRQERIHMEVSGCRVTRVPTSEAKLRFVLQLIPSPRLSYLRPLTFPCNYP